MSEEEISYSTGFEGARRLQGFQFEINFTIGIRVNER
jgi:hypothetical protein